MALLLELFSLALLGGFPALLHFVVGHLDPFINVAVPAMTKKKSMLARGNRIMAEWGKRKKRRWAAEAARGWGSRGADFAKPHSLDLSQRQPLNVFLCFLVQINSPLKFFHNQALVAVLAAQNVFKVVGDAGLDALKLGDAHGPQVLAAVAVLVLAAPGAGHVGIALAHGGDVYEHAVAGVDPAGIDDVHAVAAGQVDVVRVDVEQVRLRDVVEGVRMLGAVHVLAQPRHGVVRHLHVQVVVPRHDLPVPPPAQQRSVRQPSLDAVLVECRQVAADQLPQHIAVLFVRDLALEVTLVIVA